MKISFMPSIYEHAAAVIGRSPWELSRDENLMWQGHAAAENLYHHSPIIVGVDIYNLEAEAYGCVVERPDGNGIPAISTPLYGSLDEARSLEPFDPHSAGRIPMILSAARRLAAQFPDVPVCIPVSGPFSVATSLRGPGLFEDVALEPQGTQQFLRSLVEGQVRFARAVVESGLDVAFFESAAAPPLLSPGQFRQVELPALKLAMARVGEAAGHPVPCIIGGDTKPILDAILDTGTGFVICPAETDQKAFMAAFGDRPDVKVRINLDPHTVAAGTHERIRREIDRILALADGRPNVLLGTGAAPYETPPANILFIQEYVE